MSDQTKWHIVCEVCGEVQESTPHLAVHLIDQHGMERDAALREAREARARLSQPPDNRPNPLVELEALADAVALARQTESAWQSTLYKSTRGDPISDEELKAAADARANAKAALVLQEAIARGVIREVRGSCDRDE